MKYVLATLLNNTKQYEDIQANKSNFSLEENQDIYIFIPRSVTHRESEHCENNFTLF